MIIIKIIIVIIIIIIIITIIIVKREGKGVLGVMIIQSSFVFPLFSYKDYASHPGCHFMPRKREYQNKSLEPCPCCIRSKGASLTTKGVLVTRTANSN